MLISLFNTPQFLLFAGVLNFVFFKKTLRFMTLVDVPKLYRLLVKVM